MKIQHLALALFGAACVLLRAAEPAPVLPPLPKAIMQFYMDANFVSCFSTAGERELVNQALRAGPPQASSTRLGMVAQMTHRLRECFHEVDPKFVHWTGAGASGDGEIIQTVSVTEERDLVRVTTKVWTLGKEQNAMLVSQYNQQPEVIKPLGTVQRQKSRTEVHMWRRHGKRWLRDAAVIVPLTLQAR